MNRMGLAHRASRYFEVDEIIPAAGQGILGVQGRAGEDYSFLEGFADADAGSAALCERAFVRELDGGCTSPVCAHAQIWDGQLNLRGLYWDEATGAITVGTEHGKVGDAEAIGVALAQKLMKEARR